MRLLINLSYLINKRRVKLPIKQNIVLGIKAKKLNNINFSLQFLFCYCVLYISLSKWYFVGLQKIKFFTYFKQ